MVRLKFLPLTLIALSAFLTVRSQEKTNLAALRQGASNSHARFQNVKSRLASMALQRNWPFTITLKKGSKAYLTGISAKGMPLYTAINDNIISAATIGTTQLWPGGSTGLNLTGSTPALKGKIGIWDDGAPLATHQELVGRILQKDGAAVDGIHATHTSGTLIASGVNPLAKGMSNGALQLIAYDFKGDIYSEMFTEAPNLLVSSNSYGAFAGWEQEDNGQWDWYGTAGDSVDYKFGYYDDEAQLFDSISYFGPDYLIVKSAGNSLNADGPAVGQPYFHLNALGNLVSAGNRPAGISSQLGYDLIPGSGNAKNILNIGAVNPIPGGYSTPSDVQLAYFSSIGPSDDGRILPQLVADGVNVLSSVSTSNTAYAVLSGTSMSCPAAAGSSFLLQEYYYKLHGTFMRAATLKGLLIHTADEAGPSDGPDYEYGYGLIDMPKAASVITSNNTDQLIQENTMQNADVPYTLPVVASGKGALMATICWTDVPGAVDEVNTLNNPAPKLVNDLDIRITGGGNTYMPWILNPASPASPATTGDDHLNNQEKIVIPNTIAGVPYTVTVSHKGTLVKGSQAYSLIVSGVGSSQYCASAPTSSSGTRIDEVVISNVDVVNPTGCTTYTNYTTHTINLQASQVVPFTIKLSTCDNTNVPRVVKIFVDYNNNGTFTDPGETAAVSAVLAGGVTTYSGNLTVPAGMTVGNTTRLRIVAEETSDTSLVKPCGSYGNGETQDYSIIFSSLTNDVGVSAVVNPLTGACEADSQRVTIRIKNYGTAAQMNFPIHLKIISGSATIAEVTTIYPDTVGSLSSSVYTFQPPFTLTAGATYIIQTGTILSGDQNSANDTISDTVMVSSGSTSTVTGEAEICNTNPELVSLRANTSDSSDAVLWFASATSTTPIASGARATTTVPPTDGKYYLGLNELTTSVGPATKLFFPNGGYNYFQGNFVKIHNDVPVTINSARLYVGAPGKVDFIVADLANYDSCTGEFSYYTISESVIDVYATTPNPSRVASSINSASDTGAVFFLNLPVPTPGDHVIIAICEDSAFLFRNNGITTNPYPLGIPGVFTITGNSAINTANCKDATFDQAYYYFFYDMQLSLSNCPSPRVAVAAVTPAPAVIKLVGDVLVSNYTSGNQWYYNDTLIAGLAGQMDTFSLRGPGVYKDVISDSVGCSLVGTYTYTAGNDIGLKVTPNPNNGNFTIHFYEKDIANADLRILDINGQELYKINYPNFTGNFSQDVHLGAPAAGMYVLQLQLGGNKYTQKIMVY